MYRLYKSQHIRKSNDFFKFRSGNAKEVFGGVFILKALIRKSSESGIKCNSNNSPNSETPSAKLDFMPRIGIITSRKVGNAVIRNRIRRIIREFFRLNSGLFIKNCDYLFIALRGISDLKSSNINNKIFSAVRRINKLLSPIAD